MGSEVLEAFHPAVREWFRTSFPQPTPAQAQAWPVIRGGENTLLMAPTGSGKTLAAFLSSIDALIQSPARGCRVVYVSPLKALAVDVERNLRAPLAGIAQLAQAAGDAFVTPAIAIRTGDSARVTSLIGFGCPSTESSKSSSRRFMIATPRVSTTVVGTGTRCDVTRTTSSTGSITPRSGSSMS